MKKSKILKVSLVASFFILMLAIYNSTQVEAQSGVRYRANICSGNGNIHIGCNTPDPTGPCEVPESCKIGNN